MDIIKSEMEEQPKLLAKVLDLNAQTLESIVRTMKLREIEETRRKELREAIDKQDS